MKPFRFVIFALMLLGVVACKKIKDPAEGPLIIKEKKEAANCYVIRPKDRLQFVAVEGNTTTKINGASRAEVIWETDNTTRKVASGEIIKKISYSDGNVSLTAGKEGNALVAVKNAEGDILWSWHIWVTHYSLDDKLLPLLDETVMDRNLGALTADVTDPLSNGLIYQFNRKDPFPGLAKFNDNGTSAKNECQMGIRGTIEYDLDEDWKTRAAEMNDFNGWLKAHPNTYINMKDLSGYISNHWSEGYDKTITDPCPYGYKISSRKFWEKIFYSYNSADFYEHYVDFEEKNPKLKAFKLPYCGYRSNAVNYAFSLQTDDPVNWSGYLFGDTYYNKEVFWVYWGEEKTAGSSKFSLGSTAYERAGAVRCVKML